MKIQTLELLWRRSLVEWMKRMYWVEIVKQLNNVMK